MFTVQTYDRLLLVFPYKGLGRLRKDRSQGGGALGGMVLRKGANPQYL